MRGLSEMRARLGGVAQCDLAGLVQRARLGDADERALERPARERLPHDRVLTGGEDQGQGRRAFPEVVSGELPGLDRRAGAVEDVVGDLEGDPQREPEAANRLVAASEQARGAEELGGLQRAAPSSCTPSSSPVDDSSENARAYR
jgi:hypothetical protein